MIFVCKRSIEVGFLKNKKYYDQTKSELLCETGARSFRNYKVLYQTKKGALWIHNYGMNTPFDDWVTTEEDDQFCKLLEDFRDLPEVVLSRFEDA